MTRRFEGELTDSAENKTKYKLLTFRRLRRINISRYYQSTYQKRLRNLQGITDNNEEILRGKRKNYIKINKEAYLQLIKLSRRILAYVCR